jgi:thiol-disulfide isomerase/thioredoxin
MSSLYGGIESTANFNEWKPAGKNNDGLVMPLVNKYIEENGTENPLLVKSGAAAFMSQTGINIKLAEAWADSSIKSLNKKTGYEEFVSIKKNYGIVKSAVKKYKEALPSLIEIADLADPWMADYWLALGNTYINLNEKDKAVDAFAASLAVYEDNAILTAALKVTTKEQLDKIIEKKKEELSSPETGKYKPDGKSKGRVILAELFTGAECPPCVAADMAFDELSEFYPRDVLAILEFHLHIPGPDPLTNPETFKRYKYYGADYGTPTVFFNGGEKITGGGPAIAAKNRYNVYNYSIKKFINDKPAAEISGTAKQDKGIVKVALSVKPLSGAKGKAELHIAVAEKSVNYTGANGINKHIFVVRDLVDGPNGAEVSLAKKSDITKTVIIDSLKSKIKAYLTNPKNDPSWRLQDFSGWRNDTEVLSAINEKNLAVVAWLQDPKTKEVLQAYYMDIK